MNDKIQIDVAIAPTVRPDHWLNDPQYAWFKHGYLAASVSSQSIPTLSEIGDIGGLYYVVSEILYENDIVPDGNGGLKRLSSCVTAQADKRDEARDCLIRDATKVIKAIKTMESELSGLYLSNLGYAAMDTLRRFSSSLSAAAKDGT